jgi:predicted nucleotidyltransferase
MNEIERFGRRIGEEFGAEKVILFGSHAQGTATQDSDVDLLIVASFEGRSVDKTVQIRLKLRPSFPVDLLVRTPEKIRQRLEMGDQFIKDILQEGKVLYEDNSFSHREHRGHRE